MKCWISVGKTVQVKAKFKENLREYHQENPNSLKNIQITYLEK